MAELLKQNKTLTQLNLGCMYGLDRVNCRMLWELYEGIQLTAYDSCACVFIVIFCIQ